MNASIIGLLIAVIMIVVVWFGFIAPAERRYHDRKLKLMQERIERRRQHLKQQKAEPDADSATSDH